jgi:hypothetical protein
LLLNVSKGDVLTEEYEGIMWKLCGNCVEFVTIDGYW